MSKDGIFRIPEPFRQTLKLTSEHMVSAVEKLAEHIPYFANYFPDFDPYNEISAPYLFIYHCMPLFDHVLPHLTRLQHELLEQLNESVLASYGEEYLAAKRRAAKGMVSRRLVKYLGRPGDVLVRTQDSVPRAYVATNWAQEDKVREEDLLVPDSDEGRHHKLNPEKLQGPRKQTYRFEVAAWSWAFDGSFAKKRHKIKIQLEVGDEDEEVKITSLNYFPLHYDEGGLHELLKDRGRMFWKCRTKHFVSYSDEDNGLLNSVSSHQKPQTAIQHLPS